MARIPLKIDRNGHYISVRIFASTSLAKLVISFALFYIFAWHFQNQFKTKCLPYSTMICIFNFDLMKNLAAKFQNFPGEFCRQLFRNTKIKNPDGRIRYKFRFTLILKLKCFYTKILENAKFITSLVKLADAKTWTEIWRILSIFWP